MSDVVLSFTRTPAGASDAPKNVFAQTLTNLDKTGVSGKGFLAPGNGKGN